MSETKRASGEYNDLRKPGWLPTAVVVNILGTGDERQGRKVQRDEVITVHDTDDFSALLALPASFTGSSWRPSDLPPIEVIDGQHRLWAFDDHRPKGAFEIPVVAFLGLDISWQAYQFWTINIKPKRINASLAFDLYPLLRTEDWLEKFDGHPIYRETRSQELVQHLWSQPESPWHQRINMLGESGLDRGMVSQASWIRSLLATFVRSAGLFGAPAGGNVLPWSRTQQAAFLIYFGLQVEEAVDGFRGDWAKQIRKEAGASKGRDSAFSSHVSLLASDVGIRGLLYVANDLCCLKAEDLALRSWTTDDSTRSDSDAIAAAVKSLAKTEVGGFLKRLAGDLARFDWRSSAAHGLTPEEVTVKKTLRGSGGYREIRRLLLDHLSRAGGDVGVAARSARGKLDHP